MIFAPLSHRRCLCDIICSVCTTHSSLYADEVCIQTEKSDFFLIWKSINRPPAIGHIHVNNKGSRIILFISLPVHPGFPVLIILPFTFFYQFISPPCGRAVFSPGVLRWQPVESFYCLSVVLRNSISVVWSYMLNLFLLSFVLGFHLLFYSPT